jgi:putative spermidine/putrescine transport system substrate-binding protein
MSTMDRRQFNKLAFGVAITASLTESSVLRGQEPIDLAIITYPGKLSEPHRWLADQMQKRHAGLKITLAPSDSQDVVAQIKAAQGYSPYDAMPNDEPPHLIGIREGYIAKRDDTAIGNLASVYPDLLAKSQGYGVPATYSLVGIAYNTNTIKTAPRSWADLWNPEYRGQVGIARTSSNLGLATLVTAAKTFGGTESDLKPGWEKLKELQPKVSRSPAILGQMLEREEIAIAPLWNNNTAIAAEKGLPIKFVMPSPGAIAIISFFSAIAKTRNPALVNEWLNGILSPEYQTLAAGAPYYFGPTVKGVTVPDAAKPYVPSSEEQVLALRTIDWPLVVPQRAKLVEEFDRNFAL